MSKHFILILVLLTLNNCSLNENSQFWKVEEKKAENQPNIIEVFSDRKKIVSEFNPELKLNIADLKTNNKTIDNKNNYGFQSYNGTIKKIGNYKFSKIENINQLNFKPLFLNDGLIFFDKKGSIIRYNKNQKIIWKNNYYSRYEKKLKPKLDFFLKDENLLVVDSIAKYYSINVNSGKLNWSKNNIYPFNSEIKSYKNKIFVIDYKNTLRCFNINDGSECWSLQTEDSFTISNSKFSLIIIDDMVVFTNSIGDITAVNIENGLITWQLPTQSSSIINETYNFKISKLISDSNSIYFSNNKNQFYSIDIKSGAINWINEINSNIKPVIAENIIFTVSNEGYLYVIEKNKGNIIRITDLYSFYKFKKRKNIKPIGFTIGNTNLYLTNSDGKMFVVDLNLGNIIKIEKVSVNLVSEPFIFNNNLFVIRNGSIVQYN